MSTSRKPEKRGIALRKPLDMATPIVGLHELGALIAERQALAPGHYELVVQYRFGGGRLADADGEFSAMAITFGGLGLRAVDEPSPMTIEVEAHVEKAAAASKPVSAQARKRARPA